MKIAIDGMGGDNAPAAVVRGAAMAVQQYGVEVVVVGPPAILQAELEKVSGPHTGLEIFPASEWLVEGEHPALALRKKKDASVTVAMRMVREGRADAFVGYGNTGGVVAAALTVLGTVAGISRPVVGGAFLGFAPQLVMMDMGGNVDVRPDQMLDFAVAGTVLARKFMGIENPKVAILSNGAEEGKGNDLVKESWPLLKKSGLNFVGAAEGIDLFSGKANVVICDGFTGNVLVKYTEGIGQAMGDWLGSKLVGRFSSAEIASLKAELRALTNTADTSGGGPMWAINGVVIKGHGRANAEEICRGIGAAKKAVEMDVVGALRTELARVKGAVQAAG
jgi:glycerol-3-phosphate acyltransferase PlsX